MHISLKIYPSQLRLPAINLLRANATILFTADFYLNFNVRFKEIFYNLFQLIFMFEMLFEMLATVLQPRPIPFLSHASEAYVFFVCVYDIRFLHTCKFRWVKRKKAAQTAPLFCLTFNRV